MKEYFTRNPMAFAQAQEGDLSLSLNCFRNKPKLREDQIIGDLLFALQNNHNAFAIAANQRGFIAPIFISKFDLEDITSFPVAHKLTDEDCKDLRKLINPTVYKNPRFEVIGDETEWTEEVCLSWYHGQEVEIMKRFKKIMATVQVLDMVAYRKNRRRVHWREVSFYLEGLPAQIFSHEHDHLNGLGLWNLSELIVEEGDLMTQEEIKEFLAIDN